MPSLLHEGILLLFRNRPSLAPELLQTALGFDVPPHTEARLESAELSHIVPTEYRADLVVLLLGHVPVLGVCVEVQLAVDAEKRWSWPVYLVTLRARHRCPCVLLVVTTDEATARWAAQPIPLGADGSTITPLVLSPASVPVVDDAAADADPELAVLSAMAHANGDPSDAASVARAALRAVGRLDEERAAFYVDLVFSKLGDAARRALEALMDSTNEVVRGEFARWLSQIARQKWKAEGRTEGRAEGRTEGKAEAVLAVLRARGLDVPEAISDRIHACTDTAQLDEWLVRAVTASAPADVVA